MLTDRRPILLLVNPSSGGKIASPGAATEQPAPQALAEPLQRHGLHVDVRILAEHDDAGVLAAQAVERGQDVVAAGGDGTVRPVATALVGTPSTLGIVPLGSWNNIARGCGIAQDPSAALATIEAGAKRELDVGVAWHSGPDDDGTSPDPPEDAIVFFEAAGVGLDAAGFGAAKLGDRYGTWSALRHAWHALRRRRTPIRLTIDSRRMRTAAPAVTVCNGPYHGLGFAIAPQADPADGLLDVVVFSGMSRLDVIRHFVAVARGRPRRDPSARYLTARHVQVEGREPLPVHADGEPFGVTPIAFAVRPGGVRVFVPLTGGPAGR